MSNLTSPHSVRKLGNHYGLLVYDLDGTLLETLEDLARAIDVAFQGRGHGRVELPRVKASIGDGARSLVQRLLPAGCDESELDAVLEAFRIAYLEVCCESSCWLPGAREFVEARAAEVPGRLQAILTNKPQAPTDRLVRHLGMDRWIARAIGGDTSLGKKPQTGGLRELMRWAGVPPERTLMIGDGPADLLVARDSGVDAVLLTTGYGQPHETEGLPALVRAPDLRDLAGIWPCDPSGR
ncbi:MAG TPA: HAD family hydrolase [Fibrobacteria bacterium]|nr:HAD family hydrolase [Fibrobacteria bacterium]